MNIDKIFAAALIAFAAVSCSTVRNASAGKPVDRSAESTHLRLLYWNIQNGMWSDQASDYDNFVKWVKSQDPDVCVWCEAQSNYKTGTADAMPEEERYLPAHWAELAARYGHRYWAIGGYRDNYPQVVTSKYPIATVAQIVGAAPDSVVSHGAGWFKIERNGKTINIVTLHTWPMKFYNGAADKAASEKENGGDKYRRTEIQYICEHTVNSVPDSRNQLWMMMGDFNSRSRRDNYQLHFSDNDSRLLVHDYITGFTPYIDTFGYRYPGKFCTTTGGKARIDYIYCTKPLFDSITRAEVISDSWTTPVRDPGNLSNFWIPSDHLPLLVDFDLK